MGWVLTQHRFPRRRTLFSVHSSRLQRILETKTDPAELSAELTKLVVAMRPGLAGCVVEAFEYDIQLMAWLISVSHGSLPEVSLECRSEIVPLVQEW